MFPSIFSIQRLVDDASIHNGKRNLIGCATPPPLMAVSICTCCLVFAPESTIRNMGSQRRTLNKHANSDIHKDALTQAEQFLAICNNERLSIASQVSTAYNASIQSGAVKGMMAPLQ